MATAACFLFSLVGIGVLMQQFPRLLIAVVLLALSSPLILAGWWMTHRMGLIG